MKAHIDTDGGEQVSSHVLKNEFPNVFVFKNPYSMFELSKIGGLKIMQWKNFCDYIDRFTS